MSKKRRKSRKRNHVTCSRREDCHHMLWMRRMWKSGYSHALREHWFFKVMLPIATVHRGLHEAIPCIPVPKARDCKFAYDQLITMEKMTPDVMQRMKPSSRLKWLVANIGDNPETVAALNKEIKYLEDKGY